MRAVERAMRRGMTAGWMIVTLAAAAAAAGVVSPAAGYDDGAAPRFVLDRVEAGGGWGRQHCEKAGGSDRTTLASRGVRIHKFLGPMVYVGFDLGAVDRSGSPHPNLAEGTTGALYLGVDDQDIAWSGGVTLDPAAGYPRINGSARIGGRDDLFLSASYASSLPVFSSDDVDVGMGTGVGDFGRVWLGASMPINRDVVGFKAMVSARPWPRVEIVGAGRYGNSRAGRIEGASLSLAYVNPDPIDLRAPGGAWSKILAREPGRFEFLAAGGIVGAVGGVMVAGAAVQRACGDAAFGPAVVGVVVGGVLGSVFGNAMW